MYLQCYLECCMTSKPAARGASNWCEPHTLFRPMFLFTLHSQSLSILMSFDRPIQFQVCIIATLKLDMSYSLLYSSSRPFLPKYIYQFKLSKIHRSNFQKSTGGINTTAFTRSIISTRTTSDYISSSWYRASKSPYSHLLWVWDWYVDFKCLTETRLCQSKTHGSHSFSPCRQYLSQVLPTRNPLPETIRSTIKVRISNRITDLDITTQKSDSLIVSLA